MIELFRNLKISTKLILSAVVIALAFIISFLVAMNGVKRINVANIGIHNQQIFLNKITHELILESGSLYFQSYEMIAGKGNIEVIKTKAAELKSKIDGAYADESYSSLPDELKGQFKKLEILASEIKMNAKSFTSQTSGQTDLTISIGILANSINKFNTELSNLLLVQNQVSDGNLLVMGGVRKDMVKRIVTWMFVLALIAAFLFAFTIRNIRISIQSTLKFTESLANGDLTVRRRVFSTDEIGMINESLEKLKEKFKEVLNSLKDVSQSIEVASNEFRSGSEVISDGANHQAAASAEISSTIEQISTMMSQLSVDAKETDRIAQKAYNGIQQGAESVDKALVTIEEIALRNSAISEISYQTKILSINASVEAARAAEFGRGFAVVADEVKKLAESSQQSASEIKKVSKKGVQITRDSAIELRSLVVEFQKTSELINKISQAGEEHVFSLSQIISTIHDLNNIIQQNASSSEELTASSEELVRLSESMNEIIKFFKLEEERNDVISNEYDNSFSEESQEDKDEEVNDFSSSMIFGGALKSEENIDDNRFSYFTGKDEEVNNEAFEKEEEVIETRENIEWENKSEDIESSEPEVKPVKRVKKLDDDSMNKQANKGVRINLSDNDGLDSQFEKMK